MVFPTACRYRENHRRKYTPHQGLHTTELATNIRTFLFYPVYIQVTQKKNKNRKIPKTGRFLLQTFTNEEFQPLLKLDPNDVTDLYIAALHFNNNHTYLTSKRSSARLFLKLSDSCSPIAGGHSGSHHDWWRGWGSGAVVSRPRSVPSPSPVFPLGQSANHGSEPGFRGAGHFRGQC